MKIQRPGQAELPSETATDLVRLAITPPKPVRQSIDGRLDLKAAIAESVAAGLSQGFLARFRAVVRHTHPRINTVILELPVNRLEDLKTYLHKKGISFEEVQAVYPLPARRR